MDVKEALALRDRMREAKEQSDQAFNAAYEALNAAIRPHAMHGTNRVRFELTEQGGTYSPGELALIQAEMYANALAADIKAARVRVRDAGINMEHLV